MVPSEEMQCRALTEAGERCEHSAQEDGFCHQHDSSDPTYDGGDQSTTAADGTGADDDSDGDDTDEPNLDGSDIASVQSALQNVVPGLIGRELDGIIEVTRSNDGWQGTVEVIERQSVPDTQDILGRYEIDFDPDGTVTGYRRVSKYRRSDVDRRSDMGQNAPIE